MLSITVQIEYKCITYTLPDKCIIYTLPEEGSELTLKHMSDMTVKKDFKNETGNTEYNYSKN